MSMLKDDYLLYIANTTQYRHTGWLLSVSGILPDTTNPAIDDDVQLRTINKVLEVLHDGSWKIIDDYYPGDPLYPKDDLFTAPANCIKCLDQTVETTYGIFLVNLLVIEYPYRGKVKYYNGDLSGGRLNKIAEVAIHSEDISIKENHIPFEDAVAALTVFGPIAVPTATRRSSIPNPLIAREKPKLLEKYAGRLNDSAAVTLLQDEIMQLDADYIAGDPYENFLISDKTKMSRLRTVGMIGAERDFIDESKISVLTQSLTEGFRPKDIPVMANTIRGGSFNRGVATAFTGADVKVASRLFQNYKIAATDCGTTLGLRTIVNEENYKMFVGKYLVGSTEPMTESQLLDLVGKTIMMRSPVRCLTLKTGVCKTCMGTVISNTRIGLPALMTNITSILMGIYMALMHGSKLSTKRYNYKLRIT